MPSQLFLDFLAGINDDPCYLTGLLTVFLPGQEPLRLNSTTTKNVLSRGETFFRSGFDFIIPSRVQEGETRTRLVVPVVDRTLLAAMKTHRVKLRMVFEIVLSRTPDVVELGPYVLYDQSREFDAETQALILDCVYRQVLVSPRPRLRYTPSSFFSMFGKSVAA